MIVAACLSLFPLSVAADPLDIAVEDAAGPWSSKDGTGFANDVVKAAFLAEGIRLNLEVLPYARCKYMVKKGAIPACFSVSPEPGLEESVMLSERPLFSLHYDYYENLERPLSASQAAELRPGTVVGIVNGYEYPESVGQLRKNGVILEEARDEETNLKKLALGRIDAAIINHNQIKPADQMLKKAGVVGKVGYAFRAGILDAFVGFSRRHPLGVFAKKKFDQGYKVIRRNGVFNEITNKWKRRLLKGNGDL